MCVCWQRFWQIVRNVKGLSVLHVKLTCSTDGMQRVVCVSHAKVPIVKIWDPELKLACDMNVNNTLALENTRMIRTYVEVDDRVRPLAMSVKHWTKRRILNDAALGGTLSSYTWICLIINFLQTRNPPILPSLQARPHEKRATPDGLVYSFDDDLASLAQFGRKNKETVGELLFEFFRYYGHELNYEQNVISVREGGLISKEGKGWHIGVNNRLCVEEPFNTSRNLGNTADDTSFRGLHEELRRAFKFAAQGDLAGCCEQYEYPAEEERTWERPPPQPRPIITPSLPSRGGRGGGRGGRYTSQFSRGTFAGARRTSNTSKTNFLRQPNSSHTSEMTLQAQQQAQYALHDQLYQQIQLLQAQEQELRMQLHNQALITGRAPPVFLRQPFIQFPMPQQQDYSGDEASRSRSGTVSHPPLNPSLTPTSQRQQPLANPTYAAVSAAGTQGSSTNPPSPSATTTLPDLRRNHRRSSVATNGSPKGALRAQSQPARPQNSPLRQFAPLYMLPQPLDTFSFGSKQRPAPEPSDGGEGSGDENTLPSDSLPSNGSHSDSVEEGQSQDVMGYYITPQQLQLYQQNAMMQPMFALSNGYTPYFPAQQDYRSALFTSDSLGSRSDQHSTSAPKSSGSQQQRSASSRPAASTDRGPLIVDGSVPPSEHRSSYASDMVDHYSTATHYTSTSDEHNINTPASFSDTLSQDFQDPVPFEMEQPPVFPRPSDSQKLTNGHSDPHSASTNGQPELLASRLQNFHLSNAEKLAQSQATTKTSPERHKNGSAHHAPSKDAAQSKNSGSGNKDSHPSSTHQATETRRQRSNSKRRPNGVEASNKVDGVHHTPNHKGKSKGRNDASHHTSSGTGDAKDRNVDHHPRKNGGHSNGTTDANHGGWQTTKKKHRRGAKSFAEPRNAVNGGPEPLPADESLRKGG